MLKRWNQFILESDIVKISYKEELEKLGLKDYKRSKQNFGLSTDEIDSYFYEIQSQNISVSVKYLVVDNDSGYLRDSLHIGEEVKPSIYLNISSYSNSLGNSGSIESIKRVINKIIAINKNIYKIDYSDLIILDKNYEEDSEDDDWKHTNPSKSKINLPDPFSIINFDKSSISYTYSEDDYISTRNLEIYLTAKDKVKITTEMFTTFYDLSGIDKVDEQGNIWCEFTLKDIAEDLFQDSSYVEKYYEPEDWDYDIYSNGREYIIDDIIGSISDINKNKLLTYLVDKYGIGDINDTCESEFEGIDDLLSNIEDDNLKSILEDFDSDVINDMIWRYDDAMTSEYYVKAEEYILDETKDYIDQYIECEYKILFDDTSHSSQIWFRFDPIIFIPYYDADDPASWSGDWSDNLHDSNISDIISNLISEDHCRQISWSDYIGDNIYLSSSDINKYIDDVLADHGIK